MSNYISPISVVTWLLLTSSTFAQSTIDQLSFGHNEKLSPDLRAIPGWHIIGEKHTPQILSDRIILTPPAPGSTRGALWAQATMTNGEWSAEISFRASGQDRGSGNLQIWYVRDGRVAVGSDSVYTIGNFEGLVLTIDQYGGKGGTLRGFLNDGGTSYKDHHSVDSLAFGHCDFSYRNLGRPSRVRMTNDEGGLKVEIDDQPCFSSDKVKLPSDYYFGISAATAENPDSFEINHFVTSTTKGVTRDASQVGRQQAGERLPNAPEQLPDADAASIRKQDEQFADLHNRIQGLSHQINNIFSEFEKISNTLAERHNEVVGKIPRSSQDQMNAMGRRVESIENIVKRIQQDVEGRDYKEHLTNLQQAVEGVRGGLADSLPETLSNIITTSAPRMGMFVFVVIAVQIMLVGVYIVYKRRRDNAPKKYL